MEPYYQDGAVTIYHGDALALLAALPASSVDLIATDPPYFRVKEEEWDRRWKNEAAFLGWMGQLCEGWRRVLKPNGSLYVFASPQMAAKVEVKIGETFNVLNTITWTKEAGWHKKAKKEELRCYFPQTERVIFAEHYGADNMAKGEAGYAAKCDELRGFVFEPLRAYLAAERDRAGWTTRKVAEAFQLKSGSRTVTGMAGHWFERVQWTLPTAENYAWLRELFAGEDLRREYEYLRREYEDLRREYEDLRREYEDLRRPFNVTSRSAFTDTWGFPTVPTGPGRHPCEKPVSMLRHIIETSSRPGGVVLDTFVGRGSMLEAARDLGRVAIGCDDAKKWCAATVNRLRQEVLPLCI